MNAETIMNTEVKYLNAAQVVAAEQLLRARLEVLKAERKLRGIK